MSSRAGVRIEFENLGGEPQDDHVFPGRRLRVIRFRPQNYFDLGGLCWRAGYLENLPQIPVFVRGGVANQSRNDAVHYGNEDTAQEIKLIYT